MVMVALVGVYVARFNEKTSDYFKGGGHIPWRLSMLSLFVSGFSAFMFVGASGYAYRNGGAALVLFSTAFPAYLLGWAIYGPLWRRTRIDTPMQFLNRRYSPSTTYFYTVLSVVPNVLMLGISVYTLCIFISSALGFSDRTFDLFVAEVNGFELILIVTGIIIAFYTLLGGLWAVIVTDALQFLILCLVTLIVFPAAYVHLGDGSLTGGFARLVREAPEGYFGLSVPGQTPLFWTAYLINIVLGYNVNWHIAQRYYSVPDERDTRRMALWCAGFSLFLPIMWVAPVMASRILYPDLASMWPALAEPSEAAFVTLALSILPHGMLGIMVAAIFAATMSSADTTFNWLAAVLTKDVYVPIRRALKGAEPSERRQLLVGKLSVAVMGLLAIWIALSMGRFGGAFDVFLKANSLYSPPMFIPVILGLVYTRTPWWSGMACFGIGVLAILVAAYAANVSLGLPVDVLGVLFSDIRLNIFGTELGRYELNTLVGTVASTTCFIGSAFFHKREGSFAVRIEALERDLRTPALDEVVRLDLRALQAYRLAGWLAVVIGAVLWIFAAGGGRGALLNLLAGALALGVGGAIIVGERRFRGRTTKHMSS